MLRHIPLILLLLGVAACGSDPESKRGAEGEVCNFDGDCRQDLICIEAVCALASSNQIDVGNIPEPDPQPPGDPGVEPQPPGEPTEPPPDEPAPAPDPFRDCFSDADCPPGERCFRLEDKQFCVVPCTSDADCPVDTKCQNGACLP